MITARSARRSSRPSTGTDTATSLAATTETRPNGKVREVLLAAVNAVGVAGVTPAGSVVFRRKGRVIGRAKLVDGTATLVLPRHIPARVDSSRSSRAASGIARVNRQPLILPV